MMKQLYLINPLSRGAMLNIILSIKDDLASYPGISQDDPAQITFFNQPQKDFNPDKNESEYKKRTTSTLGRYLVKKYKVLDKTTDLDISEKELKLFVQAITDNIEREYNILSRDVNILSGDDIVEFYSKSETAHSCMSKENSYKIALLGFNPDKVQLITLDNARALLWHCDDDTIVLDRVYPRESRYVLPLRIWAKNKGYILRKNPDQLVPYGTTVELSDDNEHNVTLSYEQAKAFPFLDTFRYGKFIEDEKKVILSNYNSWGNTEFIEPTGSFKGIENTNVEISTIQCADCDSIIAEDNHLTYLNKPICSSCFRGNYCICEDCNDVIKQEDSTYLSGSYYCKDCFGNKGFFCKECGEASKHDNGMSYDDDFYCENCFYELFAHCDDCDETYSINDCIQLENKTVCNTCLNDDYKQCAVCNEYEPNNDIVNIDPYLDTYLCQDCNEHYAKCSSCEQLVHKSKLNGFYYDENQNKSAVCDECRPKFNHCDKCGSLLDYKPINNTCKNCLPELYNKQYKLPFSNVEQEQNTSIKNSNALFKLLKLSKLFSKLSHE